MTARSVVRSELTARSSQAVNGPDWTATLLIDFYRPLADCPSQDSSAKESLSMPLLSERDQKDRTMPERPKEHKIGERARSAVTDVLADEGYAIDEVSKDYGDDLLVQTDHKGHMDASRLWVQVKGTDDVTRYRTSKKSSKDRFSLQVHFNTAIRWIRTIDLAIVVLWDVERKTGWYAVPRRQIDVWDGTMSGQKHVTLHFGKTLDTESRPPKQGEFTSKAVARLAWESRFEHFHMLMLDARHVAEWREGKPLAMDGQENRKLTLVMAEFLRLLELTDPEHPKPSEVMVRRETRERAVELYKALIYGEPIDGAVVEKPNDPVEGVRLIAGKVILERLSALDPDLAMPALLLGNAAHALALSLGLARYLDGESPRSAEVGPGGAI